MHYWDIIMNKTARTTTATIDNVMCNVAEAISADNKVGYALFDPQLNLVHSTALFWALAGAPRNADLPPFPIKFIASVIDDTLPETVRADIGDAPTLIERFEQRVAAREPYQKHYRSVKEAGRSFELSYQVFDNGYTLFTAQDVTKEESDKRVLKLGLEVGSSGYWSYNFTKNSFFFSDLITSRMTERDNAIVQAQGLFGIVHDEDRQFVQDEWHKMRKGGETLDITYRVCLEEYGVLWLHNVGRMQYDNKGEKLLFVAFVRDVTEDKRVREELLASQQASVAKSDFLAKMSHEIKTPLNAIIGMSDALSQEALPEDVLETISFITNAAEGLNGLLSQTLDHAKLLSGNVTAAPEPTSLHSLVKNTCGMWKVSCKNKGIDLKVRLDPSLPDFIMLDQHGFRQCLNNLLSNAIKFTHKGEIAVDVTSREVSPGKSMLLISVKDTGIGMADTAVKTVFDPFKQADDSITRRFGGTGLGMAITKQLIDVLGGKITVRSTLGKGTVFLMALPLTPVKSARGDDGLYDRRAAPRQPANRAQALPENHDAFLAASNPSANKATPAVKPALATERIDLPKQRIELSQSEKGKFSGLRILVVEDNPINQTVVRKLISKEVKSLTFAGNGVEAMSALRTQSFDLILMDIHMPIKDGIETTIEIRNSEEAWANVVIIALTADPDYQQQRICRNIGMNATIAKPVKRQDILDAIEGALNENALEPHAMRQVQFS